MFPHTPFKEKNKEKRRFNGWCRLRLYEFQIVKTLNDKQNEQYCTTTTTKHGTCAPSGLNVYTFRQERLHLPCAMSKFFHSYG